MNNALFGKSEGKCLRESHKRWCEENIKLEETREDIYIVHTHQQMHYLLTWLRVLNLH